MGHPNPATVPSVDVSALFGDDAEARRKVAEQLSEACQINGCVGLTGCVGLAHHSLPAGLLEEAFDVSRRLYSLPYEDKMKAHNSYTPIPRRGYSGLGKDAVAYLATAKADNPTLKEDLDAATDYKVSRPSPVVALCCVEQLRSGNIRDWQSGQHREL